MIVALLVQVRMPMPSKVPDNLLVVMIECWRKKLDMRQVELRAKATLLPPAQIVRVQSTLVTHPLP